MKAMLSYPVTEKHATVDYLQSTLDWPSIVVKVALIVWFPRDLRIAASYTGSQFVFVHKRHIFTWKRSWSHKVLSLSVLMIVDGAKNTDFLNYCVTERQISIEYWLHTRFANFYMYRYPKVRTNDKIV